MASPGDGGSVRTGYEFRPCTNLLSCLSGSLLLMQGTREPKQSHHLAYTEKPYSEGGSWLKLKQMLCGNNYLRETQGGCGRDNETPRDLGVSFPRSKGVSSLELELAAVVRISFPFSLLLLFPPSFLPPSSGDGGEGDLWSRSHVASREPRLQWCCARNATC